MKSFPSIENDPFRAVWRFIRYDDYEIFEADDAYFDRQAREIAEAGFTHVMTFSNTHFRWSFRRDFERLTEVLRRQVAACHRHNLRIVEHHSANLSWNYQTPEQRIKALGQADPARWPHFEEDMSLDSTYRGVRFGDLLQVSGATGKPFISFMNSYIMCHNNRNRRHHDRRHPVRQRHAHHRSGQCALFRYGFLRLSQLPGEIPSIDRI